MVGINITKMVNVPAWYLSVLLICGYFVFYLLYNYKKVFVEFICPIFIIVVGTWFYRNFGYLKHSALGENTTIGIYWNSPLFLGGAMVCIGVLVYYIFKNGLLFHNKKIIRILEVVFLLGVPVLAIVYRFTSYDFLMVAMLIMGVMFAFFNGSCQLAGNSFIKYMSRLSYPLYLNHNMFRELIPCYIEDFSIIVYICYLVLVTLYSMLTMLIIDKITHVKERKY